MKVIFSILVMLSMLSISVLATENKKELLDKPVMLYGMGSCGEFIRSTGKNNRSEKVKYNYYKSWVRGYVTGLNSSLANGGNVLGSDDASVSDFMILVENYCRKNPLDEFINGVSVPLHKLQPIDHKGKPYKRK